MNKSRVVGSFNVTAAIICFIMMLMAIFDSAVALRWIGYFLVFIILNSVCAYYNFKKAEQ